MQWNIRELICSFSLAASCPVVLSSTIRLGAFGEEMFFTKIVDVIVSQGKGYLKLCTIVLETVPGGWRVYMHGKEEVMHPTALLQMDIFDGEMPSEEYDKRLKQVEDTEEKVQKDNKIRALTGMENIKKWDNHGAGKPKKYVGVK